MTTIKSGDRKPSLSATLKQDGVAIDLTGATVLFRMRRLGGDTSVGGACVVTDAAAGGVRYDWAVGDTDTPGRYDGEFEITHTDGTTQTVPSNGYLSITVQAALPDPA